MPRSSVLSMFSVLLFAWHLCGQATVFADQPDLISQFRNPPDSARPGVYWYIMDGHLNREGITADLESMKEAGIGNLVFLEVNVGVPRGSIDFLSDKWQELFAVAVHECERLGIELTLGSGPGWAGSGGPWVRPEQSMQHLVASSTQIKGPVNFHEALAKPEPRTPFFGGSVTGALIAQRDSFYEDVVVLAFPTPSAEGQIADVDEKALYYRAPYSSQPGVKPFIPSSSTESQVPDSAVVHTEQVIDISSNLQSDGRLLWQVPPGDWTVMRFGIRNTGATTRPAPDPGFGFECDKLDASAFDAHLEAYVGKLLKRVGPRMPGHGWTMMHIDSWEMGSQNWTAAFAEEFRKRCGYDPTPYLPAYTGLIVDSPQQSERFLWDVRCVAQALVLENHAGRLKQFAHEHGMGLSIEPYDMNPTSDMELGGVADVPMCEFWSPGNFDSTFSCIEATSIAHTLGRPIVAAEAFTDGSLTSWEQHPGSMKDQGDWAFCCGINRFVYHTFAHKSDERLPGMAMGPYGVHWDRGQTWWPMVAAYHRYITRCQYMLRQGAAVADICYLAAEGAPHVFRPPPSALTSHGILSDRRGYNFDGCAPSTLLKHAAVEDGRIVFPGGAAYELLVLPASETMTPELLQKISELVEAGATVVGPPPVQSPSLVDYPNCDQQVSQVAEKTWGPPPPESGLVRREFGKGKIVWNNAPRAEQAQQSLKRPIADASWIWYPEGEPAAAAQPGTRYFRYSFTLDGDKHIKSARCEVTADNDFDLSVNGSTVMSGNNFHSIYSDDVASLLKPGPNTISLTAINGGDNPNPAGVIAALSIQYQDDSQLRIITDANWQTTRELDGGDWVDAKVLGAVDMAPWHLKLSTTDAFESLYPDYSLTAQLLAEKDVLPDFESSGPIRYTHRRTDQFDIYFVSNRTAEIAAADCVFRVAGCVPQLWDPLTGDVRALPQFDEQAGRTTIPMRFEPQQSFFVVFHRDNRIAHDDKKQNFDSYRAVELVDGPWRVDFDAKLGGPANVTFAELSDWSQNTDESIKHFSGTATYQTTFDMPQSPQLAIQPVRLDLGSVHNLARVRLNGKDLGVLWCAPWSVDISDAVKPTGNKLEIEVANLWRNRFIGDKSLSPEQQVAWTTNNPYQPTSPLRTSGLLGPVRIMVISLTKNSL